jgi:CCR4-NOT transcriptional regulation complex NOT5 subunit
MNTLETLINLIQDNQISSKKIFDIRDSVDDYVDRNMEPDFEEILDLFDELELDKIIASRFFFVFKPLKFL